ncbi:hypothetical protein BC829DRAFT_440595 [Chytridium lagenaria]|nr:hypothetical protein BC829DRAFT_440595 [Chytridium lagenaria]
MHLTFLTAILLTSLVSAQSPKPPTNNHRVFIDYSRQANVINDCRKYGFQQTTVRCLETYWNFGGIDTVRECMTSALMAFMKCEDAVLKNDEPMKWYNLTYTPSWYNTDAWKTLNTDPNALPTPISIPAPTAPAVREEVNYFDEKNGAGEVADAFVDFGVDLDMETKRGESSSAYDGAARRWAGSKDGN